MRRRPVAMRLLGTPVMAFWTGRSDGDQRSVVEGKKLPPSTVPRDTTIAGVHQVHGGHVVEVGSGSEAIVTRAGLPDGDAVLATDDGTCAVILVADCVPIAIGSPEGIRVAVHAGWRGLVAGVVQNAAKAARSAGGTSLVAALGPCIGPCCYEFSPEDLKTVDQALGVRVRGVTDLGSPALDLRAGALGVLESAGVEVCSVEPSCTSCSPGWYSARARSDTHRQALYVWRGG
jgi:YfiH family protein